MSYVAIGCRVVLAVVFAVAMANKVRDKRSYADFRRSVAELLPRSGSHTAALASGVVILESTIAIAVLVPPVAVAGLWSSLVVLAVFTGVVIAALRRGTSASCSCFGSSTRPLGSVHLVRNGCLLLTAVLGLVAQSTSPGAAELGDPRVVLAVGSAVTIAALLLHTDAIADLFTHRPPHPAGR